MSFEPRQPRRRLVAERSEHSISSNTVSPCRPSGVMPSIPHFRAFRLRTDGQVNNAEPKLDTAGADRMPVQNRKVAGKGKESRGL